MSKVITRFEPLPDRPVEECERHYLEAHVPMAQDQLLAVPGLRSYHINRALWQLDVAGGFRQRPRAWRLVILRLEPEVAFAFTPEVNEMIAQDHTNVLYRMRSTPVDETVLVDRLANNLALAKFVVEFDRHPEGSTAEAERATERVIDAVAAAVDGAFGLRMLTVNRVLGEVEAEPVSHPGQRAIGMLEASTKLAYLECYFDHARWGQQALAGLASVDSPLRDPALAQANVMLMEEQAPLDLREPAPGPG